MVLWCTITDNRSRHRIIIILIFTTFAIWYFPSDRQSLLCSSGSRVPFFLHSCIALDELHAQYFIICRRFSSTSYGQSFFRTVNALHIPIPNGLIAAIHFFIFHFIVWLCFLNYILNSRYRVQNTFAYVACITINLPVNHSI